MSILEQILQSEKKAASYKEEGLKEKRTLIEASRTKSKEEETAILSAAKKEIENIQEKSKADLKALDESFSKEINALKAELLKDLDAKIDRAFKYLLEVI